MKFKLIRKQTRSDGFFGEFQDERGHFLFVTLERYYPEGPKLDNGIYTCKRGVHCLGDGEPFQTFEVMKVPGNTGILFHVGNYNADSEGCVLLGQAVGNKSDGGKMIVGSNKAFKKFMEILKYEDSFELIVE